ncbi:hypothetical protein Q5H92_05330 [Hymenobacter sp. M29]|uniref:Uncharacterized protein n=1 Tax=Hymenobacter mellowenesis TaxID=3063995 RepID=A0ABT9A7F1_9BACT|nr:hypothetical protein [Hymenobacter sp. M29]
MMLGFGGGFGLGSGFLAFALAHAAALLAPIAVFGVFLAHAGERGARFLGQQLFGSVELVLEGVEVFADLVVGAKLGIWKRTGRGASRR